jgi:glycosidase
MAAIKEEYPNFTVVGEVFHGDPVVTSFFQGGAERWDGVDSMVDMVFDFPLYFAINDVLTRGDVAAVSRVLASDALYTNPALLVTHLGNHDTQRLARTAGRSAKRVMLAQTFLLTTRGIPQLYYGDEIGMDGGGDPDNRRDFPGGWPGDGRDAFSAEGRTKSENKIHDHVKRLLEVRATTPALRGGSTTFLGVVGGTMSYVRQRDDQKALVVFNLASSQQTVRVPVRQVFADGTLLRDAIAGKVNSRVRNGTAAVKLKALSAAILLE